jgi:hypothetical protein
MCEFCARYERYAKHHDESGKRAERPDGAVGRTRPVVCAEHRIQCLDKYRIGFVGYTTVLHLDGSNVDAKVVLEKHDRQEGISGVCL